MIIVQQPAVLTSTPNMGLLMLLVGPKAGKKGQYRNNELNEYTREFFNKTKEKLS